MRHSVFLIGYGILFYSTIWATGYVSTIIPEWMTVPLGITAMTACAFLLIQFTGRLVMLVKEQRVDPQHRRHHP